MQWLNWPNRITIARIVLVVPFVICLLNVQEHRPWRIAALIVFLVMAASDALDGFLARRLDAETPIGKFLDPVGDKLLITCAVILLALESTSVTGFRLPSAVTVLAIAKDVLTVIGFALVYATTGEYFVQPRPLGKACTLAQCALVGVTLAGPDLPERLHPAWIGLYWAASVLAVLATIDYCVLGGRYASAVQRERQEQT